MVSLTSGRNIIVYARTIPLSTFKFDFHKSTYYLSSTRGRVAAKNHPSTHRLLCPGILPPLLGLFLCWRGDIFRHSRILTLALFMGAPPPLLLPRGQRQFLLLCIGLTWMFWHIATALRTQRLFVWGWFVFFGLISRSQAVLLLIFGVVSSNSRRLAGGAFVLIAFPVASAFGIIWL